MTLFPGFIPLVQAEMQHFEFYSRLFADLTSALNGYVHDTASAVMSSITPVATTLGTIYVILWGWSMIRGTISEPIIDGFTRIVRLAVIFAIALNIGKYSQFISGWLYDSPDRMASIVAGAGGDTVNNGNYLDRLMEQAYNMGADMMDAAEEKNISGIPDFTLLFAGFSVIIAGALATAYGAFLLALAKMALAILLGIGPIFILGLIFEGTKRFFDSWLGQVMNYVFTVVLTAAAIHLILEILKHYFDTAGGLPADVTPAQAMPPVAFALIGFLTLVQIPSIASALGGGVAVSTLGAVSWAYAKAGGVASGLRPQNIEKGINSIKRDVRAAKRGAAFVKDHMPQAAYRRITGADRNSVSKG